MSTLLAEAQLQPHKSRYWLNTKETDPEVFHQQVQTVCECYLQAQQPVEKVRRLTWTADTFALFCSRS